MDPEKFCSADEFVCLICIKKFKQRRLLKNHIMRTHFGFNDETKTTEEIRIDVEEDPLENPLADSESDPLNSSLTEGEKNATDCDIIEIKDVELIKANGDLIGKKPDKSPKPVTIPIQPKPLSDTEKVCKQNSMYFCKKNILFRLSLRKCSINSGNTAVLSALPGEIKRLIRD